MPLTRKRVFYFIRNGFVKNIENHPRHQSVFKYARGRVLKQLLKDYKDRKVFKRDMRQKWVNTLSASVLEIDSSKYSIFKNQLYRSNLMLDRKILAELAISEPLTFKAVYDELQLQVPLPKPKAKWHDLKVYNNMISTDEALKYDYIHYDDQRVQSLPRPDRYIKHVQKTFIKPKAFKGELDEHGTPIDINDTIDPDYLKNKGKFSRKKKL